MEDQYVVLLEKVVAENVRLREAIEKRDTEQQRLLERLSSKLDSTDPVPPKANRKRRRKIAVPQPCRQDFRKMYKALAKTETFQGFMLGESFTAEANQNATKMVIDAVVADHGGNENCPWSVAELKGAATTYLKSLSDASMRAKRGRGEAHKDLCRKQGRMRDKIQRRLTSLRTMPWSEDRKALVELAVGSPAYNSSEESDFSEDESGEPRLSGFLVKKLPWERSLLTKYKKALDDAYIKSLKPRARGSLVARRLHSQSSKRRRPIEVLDWAVKPEEPASPLAVSTPPTSRRPSAVSTPSPASQPSAVSTPSTRSRPSVVSTPSSSSRPSAVSTPRSRPAAASTPPTSSRPSAVSTPCILPAAVSTPPISSRPSAFSTPRSLPSSVATPSTSSGPSSVATPSTSSRPSAVSTPSTSSRPSAVSTPSTRSQPSAVSTASFSSHSSAPSVLGKKKSKKAQKNTVHRPLPRISSSPVY